MATIYRNLSDYDSETMPDKVLVEKQSFAIAVADWNPEITYSLLNGAYATLVENGVREENIRVVNVPGTFELTHAAAKLARLHKTENGKTVKKYNAIIVVGCVIQGETPHFTFVCNGVTQGITDLNLLPDACPVVFGVLTTNTLQQAKDRAGGIHGNKGDEAAITAIKMANIIW